MGHLQVQCMVHATTVRAQYKSALQSVATATGTTFTMAPMKKLFRVLEKCSFGIHL